MHLEAELPASVSDIHLVHRPHARRLPARRPARRRERDIYWLDGPASSGPIASRTADVADTCPSGPASGSGFTHIVPKGLDHILFVLRPVPRSSPASSMRLRQLVWQVSAFTIAHTVTLGLSLYGIVARPATRRRTTHRAVGRVRRRRESLHVAPAAVAHRRCVRFRPAPRARLRRRHVGTALLAGRPRRHARVVQRGRGAGSARPSSRPRLSSCTWWSPAAGRRGSAAAWRRGGWRRWVLAIGPGLCLGAVESLGLSRSHPRTFEPEVRNPLL